MTKVVYNDCFGGFGLSPEAVKRGREISGNPKWGGCYDTSRTDPVLVQVIEEMGKKANGFLSSLAIEDVPAGTKYRIDEYDGSECVMTINDYEWETA